MTKIHETLSQHKLLKIGELAKQVNVAVGTIRYYETLGLVEPVLRSENGYRYYAFDAIKKVQFIKKAQSVHFSLSEIQQVLGICDQGKPACLVVRKLLNNKIADLEEQIERMKLLKTELEMYQDHWTDKPLDEPSSQQLCSLIEEVDCKEVTVHK